MLVANLFQTVFVLLACEALTGQAYNPRPYLKALEARQSGSSASPLRVDLGYEIYEGTSNGTSKLNIWRG
jgi:hypothetical protein